MRPSLLPLLLLLTAPLYGQAGPSPVVDKPHAQWRVLDIPEVLFFTALYQDDYLSDTLAVDGKLYFFSQSPAVQLPRYLIGETDPRGDLHRASTRDFSEGRPDKGYVLHFSLDADHRAFIDRGTYLGTVFPAEWEGQPLDLWKLHAQKTLMREDGTISATFLDGNYRVNDLQQDLNPHYSGNRYIAVFAQGKLIDIVPDTEKTEFNAPFMDLNERPEGTSPRLFIPEYVYYREEGDKHRQEPLETAIQRWRERFLQAFHQEPFLPPACAPYLEEAWLNKPPFSNK